jgi:hypothetical protein
MNKPNAFQFNLVEGRDRPGADIMKLLRQKFLGKKKLKKCQFQGCKYWLLRAIESENLAENG